MCRNYADRPAPPSAGVPRTCYLICLIGGVQVNVPRFLRISPVGMPEQWWPSDTTKESGSLYLTGDIHHDYPPLFWKTSLLTWHLLRVWPGLRINGNKLIKDGLFPKPVKLGRSSRWLKRWKLAGFRNVLTSPVNNHPLNTNAAGN